MAEGKLYCFFDSFSIVEIFDLLLSEGPTEKYLQQALHFLRDLLIGATDFRQCFLNQHQEHLFSFNGTAHQRFPVYCWHVVVYNHILNDPIAVEFELIQTLGG